ncbi:hypothetical protein GCM10028796_30540 [Ramlibacter monticola]|uniref:Uncharacterized protein n=1 Tax=Ramlibacter monticola TaxID=1926872 RepID=A0A936Z5L2_9BURK|nr:hypothetical protein [Ramlibacter monticola]MBL0394707.1 hypothetical protein [Ramlibacter monticola]
MRFQPDTWLEAMLRPVAMAAPDANVYVEIMAPDLRFVFVLALLAVLAAFAVLRRRRDAHAADTGPARNVYLMLGVLAIAFVPWLATTGNGRYFLAGLLLVGPVCVGLARLLPATRAMRITAVAGMLALQAFVVQQSAPWRAWTMIGWSAPPYVRVDLPADARSQPATYVTMSAITYSLLAPLFHPGSRWMSLHSSPAPEVGGDDARRAETFLAKGGAQPLRLLVPVVPGMLTPERLPDAQVSRVIGEQLAVWRLGFRQPQSCRFLAAPALGEMWLGEQSPQQLAQAGFWLCELQRIPASAAPPKGGGHRHDAVFKVLETQCPRFFPPGGDGPSLPLSDGEVRSYVQAEMKAYVYDSGAVYYKYYRALNRVLVGSVPDLLAGKARVDCDHIRGRSGTPWKREI